MGSPMLYIFVYTPEQAVMVTVHISKQAYHDENDIPSPSSCLARLTFNTFSFMCRRPSATRLKRMPSPSACGESVFGFSFGDGVALLRFLEAISWRASCGQRAAVLLGLAWRARFPRRHLFLVGENLQGARKHEDFIVSRRISYDLQAFAEPLSEAGLLFIRMSIQSGPR